MRTRALIALLATLATLATASVAAAITVQGTVTAGTTLTATGVGSPSFNLTLNGVDQICGDFRICNESGDLLRDMRDELLFAMVVPDQENFCNGKKNFQFLGAAKKCDLVH